MNDSDISVHYSDDWPSESSQSSQSSQISDDEEFTNSDYSGDSDGSRPREFKSDGIPIKSREEVTTISYGILVPIPEDIDEVIENFYTWMK